MSLLILNHSSDKNPGYIMMRKIASITTTTTSLIYFHWYFYIPTSFDSTATNTYKCIINIVSPFLVEVDRAKNNKPMYETACQYMARSTYSWKKSSPNCQILAKYLPSTSVQRYLLLRFSPNPALTSVGWFSFPIPSSSSLLEGGCTMVEVPTLKVAPVTKGVGVSVDLWNWFGLFQTQSV